MQKQALVIVISFNAAYLISLLVPYGLRELLRKKPGEESRDERRNDLEDLEKMIRTPLGFLLGCLICLLLESILQL